MLCLTPEQIESLAGGAVDRGQAEELRRHVEQCETCSGKLDECLRADSRFARAQHDRRAMRIARADERTVVAAQTLVAHPDVGLNVLEEVTHVDRAVRVRQRTRHENFSRVVRHVGRSDFQVFDVFERFFRDCRLVGRPSGDDALVKELPQSGVHRDHAVFTATHHRVFEFVERALANNVGDGGRIVLYVPCTV